MQLANKNVNNKQFVTKKEFEKSYVDLIERVRLMDQKLSTKADEVVLTMTLAHRQEIEELQTEVLKLNQELKSIKRQQANSRTYEQRLSRTDHGLFKNWFKKVQLARK